MDGLKDKTLYFVTETAVKLNLHRTDGLINCTLYLVPLLLDVDIVSLAPLLPDRSRLVLPV